MPIDLNYGPIRPANGPLRNYCLTSLNYSADLLHYRSLMHQRVTLRQQIRSLLAFTIWLMLVRAVFAASLAPWPTLPNGAALAALSWPS